MCIETLDKSYIIYKNIYISIYLRRIKVINSMAA